MPNSAETLIEELIHNSKAAGNRILERRLADLAIWFYNNKQRVAPENLLTRQAMLEKALWTLLEVNALQTERLHELEAIKKGRSRLWVPRGMKLNGSDEFA